MSSVRFSRVESAITTAASLGRKNCAKRKRRHEHVCRKKRGTGERLSVDVQQLIAVIQTSTDPTAIDDAILALQKQFRGLIRKRAHDLRIERDDADSVALVTIWKAAKQFDGEAHGASFMTYLHRALTNEMLKFKDENPTTL